LTARRCDRCGHPADDAIGTRQASLFDVTTDPLVTTEAKAELRTGRILCSACRRTDDLFTPTTPIQHFDVDPNDVDGSVDRGMSACVASMHRVTCAACGWTIDNRGPWFLGWQTRGAAWICSQCATGQQPGNATPDAESLPGEEQVDAAQIADFYAEQQEQDRDDADDEAARVDAARGRLAEQDRIARIPRAVLDEQRAAAVRNAQGWHDNHDGTERRSTLEPFPVAPRKAPRRRKDWRGAAKAESWDRARAGK
jgi:hypothetical protein